MSQLRKRREELSTFGVATNEGETRAKQPTKASTWILFNKSLEGSLFG